MAKNHLKTLVAPKTWQIKRKKNVYIVRPRQSGHPMDFSMPISLIFKDMLKYCKTTREARKVIQENNVLIDGKKVLKTDQVLGFLGTLEIKNTKEYYRMTLTNLGKLTIKPIDKKEANLKALKIKNKSIIGKNKVQVNLTGGRNLLLKKDNYKTGDTLILKLPEQEVKEHIKLEKGSIIMLSKGRHAGNVGNVEEVIGKTIKFKGDDKKVHETKREYAFVIGSKKPSITV